MQTDKSSRTVLILWSIVMLGLSLWLPAGYWTIDDGIKSIAARRGEAPWSSPIADDSLRAKLLNPADYPVFVPPFAERVENGVEPGFSPYARLLARIESVMSRRALMVTTTLIALGVGWTLYGAGLAWGFLLLPLTFYGLVPWEHGLALCFSSTALIAIFLKDRASSTSAIFNGALLACATALRPEHGLLLLAGIVFLFLNQRGKEGGLTTIAGIVSLGLLFVIAGSDEMLRQSLLNQATAVWSVTSRVQAILDTVIAMGPSILLSMFMIAMLLLSLSVMDKPNTPRLLSIIAWGGVAMFVVVAVRVVWNRSYPPIEMLTTGSIAFAMPWILWLFTKREAWKTKAMAYATAVLVLGILLIPQSAGVHWGPRLLLFSAPLFLIALYQANLHLTKAFAALVVLSLAQSVHSGVVVASRYAESSNHETRLRPHIGSPLITTSRSQAIDLAGLWDENEFFVASNPEDLKRLLVEFYLLRRDSVWLHQMPAESLMFKTFPNNRPVWPHQMSLINCGNLYHSQWQAYKIVMNRADLEWIPLLEQAAGRAIEAGDLKRALFLQDDVLRLNPKRATAYSNMALILARMGKSAEAKRAVENALELDSTLIQARDLAREIQTLESGGAK
ncbi:MAG: hypothetical protein IPP40_12705 [bacterium]|nr:hypothetical protein [bacterium]